MRYVADFSDYEVIDCSCGEKLERFGDKILIRPDPQIIWNTEKKDKRWKTADAKYFRSEKGGGNWDFYNKIPENWEISYKNLKDFNEKSPELILKECLRKDYYVNMKKFLKDIDNSKNFDDLNIY